MSREERAEAFAALAERKGCQTLRFDLPERGERSRNRKYRCDIWNGIHDLSATADHAFPKWSGVSFRLQPGRVCQPERLRGQAAFFRLDRM